MSCLAVELSLGQYCSDLGYCIGVVDIIHIPTSFKQKHEHRYTTIESVMSWVSDTENTIYSMCQHNNNLLMFFYEYLRTFQNCANIPSNRKI